jgi:signal transduction histidine kinase
LLWTVRKNYLAQKSHNLILQEKNTEIESQNTQIVSQQKYLIQLNEEITIQQEELLLQRNTLDISNKELENANKQMKELNENLEKKVKERTAILQLQNEQLTQYAFMNAHKLRSPLASMLGLVNILRETSLDSEQTILMNHLAKSGEQLDNVVKAINHALENGMNLSEIEG